MIESGELKVTKLKAVWKCKNVIAENPFFKDIHNLSLVNLEKKKVIPLSNDFSYIPVEKYTHFVNLDFSRYDQKKFYHLQFWKMNMDHLLNKPYVNKVNLREQNLPLKCC